MTTEATKELPPAQDLKALIKQEHQRAEVERLRAGFDGCGCAICQELYKTLDLSAYGDRVNKSGDLINIVAGKDGADLWISHHPPDFLPSGRKSDVSKIPHSTVTPNPIFDTPSCVDDKGTTGRQRGRPRKGDGEKLSRMTVWRREKETQGVLV